MKSQISSPTCVSLPCLNGAAVGSATHDPVSPLLTEKDAARYLKTSPQYLVKWRFLGQPKVLFIRIGRMIRYRQSDLDAFVRNHTPFAMAGKKTAPPTT